MDKVDSRMSDMEEKASRIINSLSNQIAFLLTYAGAWILLQHFQLSCAVVGWITSITVVCLIGGLGFVMWAARMELQRMIPKVISLDPRREALAQEAQLICDRESQRISLTYQNASAYDSVPLHPTMKSILVIKRSKVIADSEEFLSRFETYNWIFIWVAIICVLVDMAGICCITYLTYCRTDVLGCKNPMMPPRSMQSTLVHLSEKTPALGDRVPEVCPASISSSELPPDLVLDTPVLSPTMGMSYSLPTPEDPFNERQWKVDLVKKKKQNQSKKVKNPVKKTSLPKNSEKLEEKLHIPADRGQDAFDNHMHPPSKFLILWLKNIQEGLQQDGAFSDGEDKPFFVHKWGTEFWKYFTSGKDIIGTNQAHATTEQIAWVAAMAADAISRKEKDGLSITSSPFLLFLAPSQEKAAKVQKICKPLEALGIHTVTLHPGASIDHQIQGLKNCEPEFLISTPERLQELLSRGAIETSDVSFLGMCYSLPTPEDPFNETHGKVDLVKKQKKQNQSKKGKNPVKKTSLPQNSDILEEELHMPADRGQDALDNHMHAPSKFLILCLKNIQEGLQQDGEDKPFFVHTWGTEFWKYFTSGKDIIGTNQAHATTEQIAWVAAVAADAISRKEKDGLSISSNPFLLFLVPSQEKAAKVRKICKPLEALGIHTVSLHPGASIDHQIQGLKNCEPEFLISTPKRLQELLSRGAIETSDVSFLVIDGPLTEAGYVDAVESIAKSISGKPQILAFSDCSNSSSNFLIKKSFGESICRIPLDDPVNGHNMALNICASKLSKTNGAC